MELCPFVKANEFTQAVIEAQVTELLQHLKAKVKHSEIGCVKHSEIGLPVHK